MRYTVARREMYVYQRMEGEMFLEEGRETGRKVRETTRTRAKRGENAVKGLERIARPRMGGIRRWEESKGRTLVPPWW